MKKTFAAHPTAMAFAATSGIVYALCAFVVGLWPQQTLLFFNSWFHGLDLRSLFVPPTITVASFIGGLIAVLAFAYAVGFLYAWVHMLCERHCKRKGWI